MEWVLHNITGAVIGYVLAWLVAAFAYALPVPTDQDTKAYIITYRLVQFAGANLDKMRGKEFPK